MEYENVFVYGTLRRDYWNYGYYLKNSKFIEKGRTKHKYSLYADNNIAIILDSDSEYSHIIESKLYPKDMNIIVKEYLKDNIQYRSFIDFLSVSLNLDSCYVKDLKPFLELLGYDIDYEYSNYLFSK